ncbi:MAG: RsbRD N-terminal domain-containing protein [Ignavibacteriaceae bacterium]|nr:RsbRD N-terminal domain-containing protein [Ignavibacteriaceae bacterium]
MITEILNIKREAIVRNWIDLIFNSYPAESANFLKLKKNQFSNPIGHTITSSAEKIFEELINKRNIETIELLLDDIIKISAVQSFSPSQAVTFLFDLKKVIRDELKVELMEKTVFDELINFELLIDQIILRTFDLYMESREKVFKIRVNEVKSKLAKAVEPITGA